MNPSLYALFRRSHYRRVRYWEDASETERLEAERFATAAVAFCLKHDPSFRRSFVKVVTGVELSTTEAKNLRVEVEPFRTADLLLKIGARFLAVVEFKIGCKLQPHQDPASPAFGAETGYGRWLRQHSGEAGIESASFTVLDQSESKIRPCAETRKLKIAVRHLHWEELLAIPHNEQSNLLISDLYETLSSLGVRAMQYEQTNNARVTASLELAGKAGSVLVDAKNQLGCADKYCYSEGHSDTSLSMPDCPRQGREADSLSPQGWPL